MKIINNITIITGNSLIKHNLSRILFYHPHGKKTTRRKVPKSLFNCCSRPDSSSPLRLQVLIFQAFQW